MEEVTGNESPSQQQVVLVRCMRLLSTELLWRHRGVLLRRTLFNYSVAGARTTMVVSLAIGCTLLDMHVCQNLVGVSVRDWSLCA